MNKKRLRTVIIFWSILLIVGLSYFIITSLTAFSIPCFIYQLTGYKCPCCGISRMALRLANFDFIGAQKENYFLFYSVPVILLILIMFHKFYLFNQKLPKWYRIILILSLSFLIIWGILRNILSI